jgi:hypothetical protein
MSQYGMQLAFSYSACVFWPGATFHHKGGLMSLNFSMPSVHSPRVPCIKLPPFDIRSEGTSFKQFVYQGVGSGQAPSTTDSSVQRAALSVAQQC